MKQYIIYSCMFGLLLGCKSGSDFIELRFWVLGGEGDHIEQLLPLFERENPGIRVRVQKIPWIAAHEKLLTAYASNSTPDVTQLGNTWIPEFVMLDALEELDRWIDTSAVVDVEDYFRGIWETNVVEGMTYGIPWYVDTRVLFYRTDILEEAGYTSPPRTWEELYDVSKKIRERAGTREQYAMLLPTNEWPPPVVMGLSAGAELLREDGKYGNFSSPEFLHAFEFYTRFFTERLAPTGVTQVVNIYQGLAEGFFAMYISGPWNVGEFRRRLPAALQDKWMTAPLPGIDEDTPGVSLAGGSSLVMFRNSPHNDAAWKLIEFFSRPEQQIIFNQRSGNLPPRYSAWEESGIKDDPYIRAFYTQLRYVKPLPQVPEWEQIALKVQQYAEIASVERMTPREALRTLDRDVDRILEKRRWILRNR